MRLALLPAAIAAVVALAGFAPVNSLPPTSPDPSVNPLGFCPTSCPGYGSTQLGASGITGMTSVVPASPYDPSYSVVAKSVNSQTGWPNVGAWYAGVYTYSYSTTDTCGTSYSATGKLDVRCNNAPIVAISANNVAQTVTVQYGQEVLLNASKSWDADGDSLTYSWCLISRPSATGLVTTTTEPVNTYLRTATAYPGYAFFKPDVTGTYTFYVVVSDGCNYVNTTMTVQATVNCCPRSLTATGGNTIVWASSGTMSYTSSATASANTAYSCLPADYVRSSVTHTINTLYKNLYSPVYTDMWGNQDVLDQYNALTTAAVTATSGCTWPGASNFNTAATQDDGSCICATTTPAWDVQSTYPQFKRRADPTNSIVPGVKTATGTLQFGGVAVPNAINPQTTCNIVPTDSWSNSSQTDDIRTLTSNNRITINPLLPRPSTSWDVQVGYKVSTHTWYGITTNTNTTTLTTATPATVCTAQISNTGTITVTRGSGQPVQQCLGYYSFVANMAGLADGCPASQDWIDVEVVCPAPPTAEILCDVSLLWDGTKFVKSTTGPTDNKDTFDGWVQIDARETPIVAGATYVVAITKQPAPLTYLGAAAFAPTPQVVYTVGASGSNNISAAFMPTYGGAGGYTVTLTATDNCNPVVSSSVNIQTDCMKLSAALSTISSTGGGATGPTTLPITPNGTYVTGAPQGNLNANLNYAIRVTKRPVLPFGDNGAFNGSYECAIGWSAATAFTSGTGSLNTANPVATTATLALAGQYDFSVSILDACAEDKKAFPGNAGVCTGAQSVSSAYTLAASTNVVFGSSGATNTFPASTISTIATASGASPPASTIFAWFLTSAPSGYVTQGTFRVYPGTSGVAPPASSLTCSAAGSTWTVGGAGALRPTADPYGPVVTANSGATTISGGFTPALPGTYTFTAEAIGPCDTQVLTTSFTAQCNAPARFLCLGYTATSAGCPSGTANNQFSNPNGVSTSQSTWNNDEAHYSPVFVNVYADAGGEANGNSNSDTLYVQVMLSGAPIQSWWSIAYFVQQLTFTFMVPDPAAGSSPAGVFEDYTGFPTLKSAISTAFLAQALAPLGLDSSRLSVSQSDLQTKLGGANGYASASTASNLGVVVTPLCFTRGIGRTFTATVTFAVLPPAHFRAWGNIAGSALTGTDPVAAGYARLLTNGLDYTPYTTYTTNMMTAAIANTVATATAGNLAGFTGSSATAGSAAFAASVLSSAPNTFIWATSVAAGSTAKDFATSFVPDYHGSTYKFDAKVWDTCQGFPGQAAAALWSSNSVTGFSLASSATTVTVVQPANCGAFPNSAFSIVQYTDSLWTPTSVTRDWYNSSASNGQFGKWSYAASGPAYTQFASLTLPAAGVCFDNNAATATCAGGPTASGQSINFNPNGQGALYAFPLPTGASGFANNGATLQFTLTGAGGSLSDGSELRLGCASHPSSAYTSATSVYYFYTFNTSVPSGGWIYNALVPEKCISQLGSAVDIVFSTTAAQSTSFAWNINNIVVTTHPAGLANVPATQWLAYQYVMVQGSTPVSQYSSLAGVLNVTAGTFMANNLNQQQFTGAQFSRLAVSTLTSRFAFNMMYKVSVAFPSWVLTSNVCSGAATTQQTASLQCPKNNPRFSTPTGVTYNSTTTLRYNAASVALDPTSFVAPYPYFQLGDLNIKFWVQTAPTKSVLNAANLVAAYLNAKHSINPANPPTATTNTPTAETATLYTNAVNTLTESLGATKTTYVQTLIDPTTVTLQLINELQGDAAWIANKMQNGDYLPYVIAQNAMASFVPDVSGSYSISATVDDGCNPAFTVTPASVSVAACTPPTLGINMAPFPPATAPGTTPFAVTIMDTGASRVLLQGVIGGATFLEDAPRATSIQWSISPSVTLMDADSLYPSFVPAQATTYTVTLTAMFGTDCMATKSQTISVTCNLSHKPNPVVSIAQSGSFQRVAQSSLALVYSPTLSAYWIGQSGCENMAASFGSFSYSCPMSTYSVRIVGVWPPVLITAPTPQVVQVTVSVGGGGIPDGLVAAFYNQRNGLPATDRDDAAVVITIGGVACQNPYIANQASGIIRCRVSGLTSSTSPVKVSTSLLGVSSTAIQGDFWVQVLDKAVVTSAVATDSTGLPATGGTSVTISGWNLALDMTQTPIRPYWSAVNTTVTIDGLPCTQVSAVQNSYAIGATATQIKCMTPANFGQNLGVVVTTAFVDPVTGTVTKKTASDVANVFSYDMPVVQSLSVTSGSTLGGYMAVATVKNLGLPYQGTGPLPSATVTPAPYADVMLTFAGRIPIPSFSIMQQETASQPAQIQFWVPSGCGTGLDLRVTRRNIMSVTTAGTTPTFSYDAPVVKCVGQPFVDSTQQGCTRIYIEGTNFGSAANSTKMSIAFMTTGNVNHGMCDNVMYSNNGEYQRLSCRVPPSAVAGDVVMVTNECGQSGTSNATASVVVPDSINLAGCGNTYQVAKGSEYSYAVNAPMVPAAEPRTNGIQDVRIIQGGKWKDQVLSNGLFIGLVLPAVLLIVIGYPLYVMMANRGKQASGGAWTNSGSGSSSAGGAAGDKTVTKGATRVTMNPVSFAPAPPIKPADAPGAVHDNL